MKFNNSDWKFIVVWALVIAIMVPGVLHYSHYLSYSTEGGAGGQSALVEKILDNASLNRETIIIVVNESPYADWQTEPSPYRIS
jgi:hypothetical protein